MYAICPVSVAPLRSQNSDKAEICSQLLFGETVEIVEKKQQWVKVKCSLDSYTGWMDEKQLKIIKSLPKKSAVCVDVVQFVSSKLNHQAIVLGSSLPEFDGINFKMGKEKFVCNGQAYYPEVPEKIVEKLHKFALKYLNAPYLWGGRSPFGIDCSGLTQMVLKLVGINIARDAYQQAECGAIVDFIGESNTGDLAFFAKDDGSIHHVGIVVKAEEGVQQRQIIHAHGQVRIDNLDHYGIHNRQQKKYSHKLAFVKRLITS